MTNPIAKALTGKPMTLSEQVISNNLMYFYFGVVRKNEKN